MNFMFYLMNIFMIITNIIVYIQLGNIISLGTACFISGLFVAGIINDILNHMFLNKEIDKEINKLNKKIKKWKIKNNGR